MVSSYKPIQVAYVINFFKQFSLAILLFDNSVDSKYTTSERYYYEEYNKHPKKPTAGCTTLRIEH